ncbi:hypothetical protein HPG69_005999 [Diceros bicornis minor]|uniref:Uncharacterized protein n=1 Tax=Diceros bicornis minor TaxID=77932 RepID=A0A7J7EPI1_DICBM|nr:hypothetical protein HPG69_005999 [Diceros bicornis minor]
MTVLVQTVDRVFKIGEDLENHDVEPPSPTEGPSPSEAQTPEITWLLSPSESPAEEELPELRHLNCKLQEETHREEEEENNQETTRKAPVWLVARTPTAHRYKGHPGKEPED